MNKKQQVMEALFNLPTDKLDSSLIMWAASHLPDDGPEGMNGKPVVFTNDDFDHDSPDIWGAVKLKRQDLKRINDALQDYMNSIPEGERCKSKAVEYLARSTDKNLIKAICVKVITDLHDDKDEDSIEITSKKKKIVKAFKLDDEDLAIKMMEELKQLKQDVKDGKIEPDEVETKIKAIIKKYKAQGLDEE